MTSLKSAFDRARAVDWGLSPLATMFWMVAIDEDRQQREREQTRRKRQALDTRPPNKPARRTELRPF